ncbi:MAG: FAD-dependent monooxygenase [Xanthobacteraceae bacterium]
MPAKDKPVIVVGAGPVGLTTALGLDFYGLPVELYEDDAELSRDTKAGTVLTRTLEAFRRYGVADQVLANALRVDEIGDIERATNRARPSVETALLREDTRYPFVINMPQHHLEPILRSAFEDRQPGALHMQHRLISFRDEGDGVVARFETPRGELEVEGSYLLACDGGRSSVRGQLGIPVEGESLDARVLLVDVKVDLDVANPRDYPYLAYFADPQEWMILVRHPHCWRFLYPLGPEAEEPTSDQFRAKVLRFIGDVDHLEILNTIIYRIHHRIARDWQHGRIFLMGDAAHLITPMWALGLNTGILDSINLPWRLAWVMRGWADKSLLEGYAREQRPVAARGSGEMAEAARKYMAGQSASVKAMSGSAWANALTRTMLGVRLDVEDSGDWSMVRTERGAFRVGDRIPDAELHGPLGRPLRLHDLTDDAFLALYFTDARRRPAVPESTPHLKHLVVSPRDAPFDSGLRGRSLFDVGDRFRHQLGCASETVVLVRPDDHIAAIAPMRDGIANELYRKLVRR